MDFSEFVGFIISLLAMLFLFLNNSKEKESRAQLPQEYEEASLSNVSKLDEFLRSLENKVDDEVRILKKEERVREFKRPVARQKQKTKQMTPSSFHQKQEINFSPLEQRRLKSSLETHEFQSSLENREFRSSFENHDDPYYTQRTEAYSIKSRAEITRVQHMMKQKYLPKDLVLIKEIIGPPKGLQ